MWSFQNPVKIIFGPNQFYNLDKIIAGRKYALITYPNSPFNVLAQKLKKSAGTPTLVINNVAPNPDYELLRGQTETLKNHLDKTDVLVALGGGSVIDTAKVLSFSRGDFSIVTEFLEKKKQQPSDKLEPPIIAIPTTSGTGSEVTRWATVWNRQTSKKYSLDHPNLFPSYAVIDPTLMIAKSKELTLVTALDALSHSMESIWNKNSNPLSTKYAIEAAKKILKYLPLLIQDLSSIHLRTELAEASLLAGLAFSNTKTALAHNLSYPMTLRWGIEHGIACSFTLPLIMRSVENIESDQKLALEAIFETDLQNGSKKLEKFLTNLGISIDYNDYGISHEEFLNITEGAFLGERGKNFFGRKEDFIYELNKEKA
jgi:phosphonate metabolism-associated iron-containing alcohol dehydrogenase